MIARSDFPEWPRAILCILVLSLTIVSIDLFVEILLNPSSAYVTDRLLYRFGLMFLACVITFVLVFRMFEKQLFGIPTKPKQSDEEQAL